MTADLLRRAAVRAQELADGATPGPWRVEDSPTARRGRTAVRNEHTLVVESPVRNDTDLELIATCDPPFLRAVGEWLERELVDLDRDLARVNNDYEGTADLLEYERGWFAGHPALAVARALLGES